MGRGKNGNSEASQEAIVDNHSDSAQWREEMGRTDSGQVREARLAELETPRMWAELQRRSQVSRESPPVSQSLPQFLICNVGMEGFSFCFLFVLTGGFL